MPDSRPPCYHPGLPWTPCKYDSYYKAKHALLILSRLAFGIILAFLAYSSVTPAMLTAAAFKVASTLAEGIR